MNLFNFEKLIDNLNEMKDMKCVGIQYLEAIRKLKAKGFVPLRNVNISFVPGKFYIFSISFKLPTSKFMT